MKTAVTSLAVGLCVVLAIVAAPSAAMSEEELDAMFPGRFAATPVVFGAEAVGHEMRFAMSRAPPAPEDDEADAGQPPSGDDGEGNEEAANDEAAAADSKRLLGYDVSKATVNKGRGSVSIVATKVVENKSPRNIIRRADMGDAVTGATTSQAAIDGVHRECPHRSCERDSACPMKNGVCCNGGNMCCPAGATCLNTDPPTCIHDSDQEDNRCAEEECSKGFHCPHEDIATCCIGGDVCCPAGFKCRATNPPTCEKILSALEKARHEEMEEQLLASKKQKVADALREKDAMHEEQMREELDKHEALLKIKEGHYKRLETLSQKAHTARNIQAAKADAAQYEKMRLEVSEKKRAVDAAHKDRVKNEKSEEAEKVGDTAKRIAEHEKRVGHEDQQEAREKQSETKRLETHAAEANAKKAEIAAEAAAKKKAALAIEAKQKAEKRLAEAEMDAKRKKAADVRAEADRKKREAGNKRADAAKKIAEAETKKKLGEQETKRLATKEAAAKKLKLKNTNEAITKQKANAAAEQKTKKTEQKNKSEQKTKKAEQKTKSEQKVKRGPGHIKNCMHQGTGQNHHTWGHRRHIHCPSHKWLRGIRRSVYDDLRGISHLQCCDAYKGNGQRMHWQHCQWTNWWGAFDRPGWAHCPGNYYMAGFYKNHCGWLHCIETALCCRMSGSSGYNSCATQRSLLHGLDRNNNWATATGNTFFTGLYRSGAHWSARLHNLEYARQCSFKSV